MIYLMVTIQSRVEIFKQMMDYNQATFNSAFEAMIVVQDQFEGFAQTAIDQANWIPEDGRKAIQNCVDVYKTGRENYKEYIDDSFKKAGQLFTA